MAFEDLDYNDLREMAQATTPGPWMASKSENASEIRTLWHCHDKAICAEVGEHEDAKFIAYIHEVIPAILNDVEKMSEELKSEKEKIALLKRKYPSHSYTAERNKAWAALLDLAEKHGYQVNTGANEKAIEWLMSSEDKDLRNKTLMLFGRFRTAATKADIALEIEQTLAHYHGK